jgi:hypothetical protein
MAQNTGAGQIFTTDNQVGRRTFVGNTTPAYPVAGDVWIDNTAGSAPSVFRWLKTAAGGETSLSGADDTGLTLLYSAGSEQVYLNGTMLVRGSDYTATDGSTIAGLSPALVASDVVNVISQLNATVSGAVSLTGSSTITGGLTTNTDSYFNGARVGKGLGSVTGNTVFGQSALNSNTTGIYNTSVGLGTLYSNTVGQANTAVGGYSLYANTTGNYNTGLGNNALNSNTTGSSNTAVGATTLTANTIGSNNVAVGANALQVNTIGANNTAVGQNALYANTTGVGNIAVGTQALYSTTIGTYNIGIGNQALYSNITGTGNVAVGVYSLSVNTVDNNTAVGSNSLQNNTTGAANVAVGAGALAANTVGYQNVALGRSALSLTTTGTQNVAVGTAALSANVGGQFNTAVGDYSAAIATGMYNTAFGAGTLRFTTTGSQNTAVGYNALFSNSTGQYNVAVGGQALSSTTTGWLNTAVGDQTLVSNIVGSQNTALGQGALNKNLASNNTALGWNALINITTGTNNTAVGYEAGRVFQSTSDMIAAQNTTTLGYQARVSGDNQVQCGNSSTAFYAYGAYNNRSDVRDKADVKDTSLGLEFIEKIRPVEFKWDYREDYQERLETINEDGSITITYIEHDKDGSKKRSRYHQGVIAQEVKAVMDELDVDFAGYQDHKVAGGDDVLTIGYTEFIAPLIKAVQELSLGLDAANAEIAKLKGAN